ncbi:MAG TPA: ATP-binding cassette domain-containing protein [Chitinophagaceae bacterium]|nr:ATP-binding cassette domain-containing protein [Chitinophagaceae bacterium]
MQLAIRNLLPSYFNENNAQSSDIWRRDLVFEKGDLVKIVAPSGTGKTSLIHFLYGSRRDYNGTISYSDKNIRSFSAEGLAAFRKDHISIVFQDMKLFADQTAEQNLEIKRQLNPYHPAEKIKEMAERLGIAERLSFKCSTCSYGEQQRIAIIRSLMQPFDILLLDEPFSHLDKINSEKAMDLMLEESNARNAAIIFVDLERFDPFPFTRLYHL